MKPWGFRKPTVTIRGGKNKEFGISSRYNLPKTHFKHILIDVRSKLIDKNIPYIQ